MNPGANGHRWWWPRRARRSVDEAQAHLEQAQDTAEQVARTKDEVRSLYGPNRISSRVAHAIRGDR